MEKIVFLDIDGVLNSNFWNENHQREISDGTLIDEEKVALLGKLVKRTGAKLVLHSGWRLWFGEGLQPLRKEAECLVEVLKLYDMVITDVTPDLTTEEIHCTKKFSLVKAHEILTWLEQHPRIGKWIVLDDLELYDESVKRQQVQTDANVGLTEGDVEKAALKLEHDCDIEQAKLINRVGMCETYECTVCGCEFSVFFNMPLPFFEPQPRCKAFVEWSEEVSIVAQVDVLKKLIPDLKAMGNSDLLGSARRKECLEVGEMTLSEGKELVKEASEQGVIIRLEEIV